MMIVFNNNHDTKGDRRKIERAAPESCKYAGSASGPGLAPPVPSPDGDSGQHGDSDSGSDSVFCPGQLTRVD